MKQRRFASDDYAEIQRRFFSDLWATDTVDADPSGWLSAYAESEKFFRLPNVTPRQFAKYNIDEGSSLAGWKERLLPLLSKWEHRPVIPDEFTLCPSGSCGSLVILAALKGLGVRKIFFETPAYFASIEQAKEIGLQVELLPTYKKANYQVPPFKLTANCVVGLFLTQPRAALGFDQSLDVLRLYLERFRGRGYVVLDEVTDQSFPSRISQIVNALAPNNLIRLRSFTKPMGLNGLRLALILHPWAMREQIVGSLEALGGSIDTHSLAAVAQLAENIAIFKQMLGAAKDQVNSLRKKAERLVAGSPIEVNHLTNGYIGSMITDLSKMGNTQSRRRLRLLDWCRKTKTPVMLGNSFYMAEDPPTEAIRLNFFHQPDHIIRGITNILRLWDH